MPRRTLSTAAAVEAAFAVAWFGGGQAGPARTVSVVLAIGSALAVLCAATGATTAYRFRADPSPLGEPTAARTFAMTVGAEFAIAGFGAAVLGAVGAAHLIAALVCLVAGVHFVPLDRVFPGLGMAHVAVAMSLVGVAAFAAAGTGVPPSTVTGLGAGLCLLGHAGSMLLAARRRDSSAPEYPLRAQKVLYRPPLASPGPAARPMDAERPSAPVATTDQR